MNTNNQTTDFEAANSALNELEARFNHWRQNKSYSRESVPIDLLQAAQALTAHVGVKSVKNRLGISSDQLKRVQQSTEQPKPNFVQVQTQTKSAQENEPLRIEMLFPNGARVAIEGLKQHPKHILSLLLEDVYDCA